MNLGYQTQLGSTCIRFFLFQDCRYSHTPTFTDPSVEMSFYLLLLTFQAQAGIQVLPHYPVPLKYHLCSLSWNLSHSVLLFLAYKSIQFTTPFSEKNVLLFFLNLHLLHLLILGTAKMSYFPIKRSIVGKKTQTNLYCCLPCYSVILLTVTKQEKSDFKLCRTCLFCICRFETNVVNKPTCQIREDNFMSL